MSGAFMEVTLEIVEPVASNIDASKASARSSTSMVWSDDTLAFDEGPGIRVVLDFQRRRRQTIDATAGTFTDDSLFAEVGLRHFELPNRAHIRSVLEAGGADGSSFASLQVEHQLALCPPTSKTHLIRQTADTLERAPRGLRALFRRRPPPEPDDGIVVSQVGDRVDYAHAGKPLIIYQGDAGLDVPSQALAQALRHRWGGHPLILAEIAALTFVPRQIELFGLQPAQFDRGPVIVNAAAARPIDWARPITHGLRRVMDRGHSDSLDSLLSAEHAVRTHDEPAIDERLAQVRTLISSGNAIQGILAFFELTLESAVALPPDIGAALRSSTDPHVAALRGTMGKAIDGASAREALAVHARLREGLARPPAVLDAFEADLLIAVGEPERAKDSLGRALAANPRLVGAYKTLGDLYIKSYQARRAWRCWDLARSFCSDHPMLRPISALEETLATSYPEYFRPATVRLRDLPIGTS
jgi:hypothetical protein